MKKLYFPKLGIIYWILILLFTIILSYISQIKSWSNYLPQFEISIVFFAAIFLSISYWQLFLYGIFVDVLYGSPIGISPFILILLCSILSRFKTNLSKQSTHRILLYFFFTMIATNIIKYVMFSIYFSVKPDIDFYILAMQIPVNMLFYMAIHALLYNKLYMKRYEN